MLTAGEKGPRLDRAGTSERAWSGVGLERLPELPLGNYRRAVVVAPHPDDEVLASGGLMQRLATRGIPLTVISVTDGEASHPSSPTVTPRGMADRRTRELRQSLDRLGLGSPTLVALALPDGAVTVHAAELEACLHQWLAPHVLCLAPWVHDGHPDHDAVGRAAVQAAATGARFLAFLVWTWHWAEPGDPRVPWHRARQLRLSPVEQTRKRWAIKSFRSQIEPLSDRAGDEAILSPEMLAHFGRPFEVFLA